MPSTDNTNVFVVDPKNHYASYISCGIQCVQQMLAEAGNPLEDLESNAFSIDDVDLDLWRDTIRYQAGICGSCPEELTPL